MFFGGSLCIGLAFAMPMYIAQKKFISAIVVGAFAGVMIGYFVSHGFYYIITRMNGAPFHKGDVVQNLSGEYKGHVVSVYEEWKGRKQVRVDLGETAMKDLKDVFSFNEICRVNRTETDKHQR